MPMLTAAPWRIQPTERGQQEGAEGLEVVPAGPAGWVGSGRHGSYTETGHGEGWSEWGSVHSPRMINAPTAIPILLPNLSENQASMGKEAICPTD
jgi:hypothetical protein